MPLDASGLLYLGVAMAVGGNTLIACSLALQKHVHNKHVALQKPASRSLLFWVSLAGMVTGEVGNFAAFGFASPTVISPLGAVSVLVNALVAFIFLREPVFMRSLLGILTTLAGTAVVVLYSPPTVQDLPTAKCLELLQQLRARRHDLRAAGAEDRRSRTVCTDQSDLGGSGWQWV